MFSPYPRDTVTSQDQARLPPLQQTTYPINNTYIHGAPIQPIGMEVSVYCNRPVVDAQIRVTGSHAGVRLWTLASWIETGSPCKSRPIYAEK